MSIGWQLVAQLQLWQQGLGSTAISVLQDPGLMGELKGHHVLPAVTDVKTLYQRRWHVNGLLGYGGGLGNQSWAQLPCYCE